MSILFANVAYALVSVGMMIWVERTLRYRGRVLLIQVFDGNEELADTISRLLTIGFYLIGLGIVTIVLANTESFTTTTNIAELIGGRIGWMLLVVGLLHFLNLQIISRLQQRVRHIPTRSARNIPFVDHILD
jgi:hypothetical protein